MAEQQAGVMNAKDGEADSKMITTTVSSLSRPVDLPEDILRMIFTEFLSKPSIHFASLQYFHYHCHGPLYRIHSSLKSWTNGTIKSGYEATRTLSKICKLGRDVVRRATAEPVFIRYEDGTSAKLDASTDMVCFVLIDGPWTEFASPTDGLTGYHGIGKIRKAGLLVTNDRGQELAARWFAKPAFSLGEAYGKDFDALFGNADSASWSIGFLPTMETFYIVLTDITEQDWISYYHTFHDHHGSYVEVHEVPVHREIIRSLGDDDSGYPYGDRTSHSMYFGAEQMALIAAQITPAERVSLLLGVLEQCRWGNGWNGLPAYRVVARKPALSSVPAAIPQSNETSAKVSRRSDYLEQLNALQPENSISIWVRLALDRIFIESDECIADEEEWRLERETESSEVAL